MYIWYVYDVYMICIYDLEYIYVYMIYDTNYTIIDVIVYCVYNYIVTFNRLIICLDINEINLLKILTKLYHTFFWKMYIIDSNQNVYERY